MIRKKSLREIEYEIKEFFKSKCYVKSKVDYDENKIVFFIESGNIERDVPYIINAISNFERTYPDVNLFFDY